ncbi:MAG: cyclodeaminase/cyclohydrolase family protein [Microbacterium sp.]
MPSERRPAPPVSVDAATVAEWTRALAEPVGDPGGGAAGALALALAASLVSMVAGYSVASAEPGEADRLGERAGGLRTRALELADLDGRASGRLSAAFRLPEGSERDREVHEASLAAASLCVQLTALAVPAVDDLERLAEVGNPALIADVVVATTLLRSALVAFRTNIGVDLRMWAGDDDGGTAAAYPGIREALDAAIDAASRLDRLQQRLDGRVLPA